MKSDPAIDHEAQDEPVSFGDYWDAVDAAMLKLFGIDTLDADIDEDLIASAQDEGWTPEEFARWCGDEYNLICIDEGPYLQSIARRG